MKCKIYEQMTDCIDINIVDQNCLICKCQKPHSGKVLRAELLVLWRWAGMWSSKKHWRCWDVRVTWAKSRPGEQSEGQGWRTKVRLQKEGKIRPEYERMDIPWEMGHVPSISLPWVWDFRHHLCLLCGSCFVWLCLPWFQVFLGDPVLGLL